MKIREQVMEVDRLFCEECRTGKEKAWASYFLDDGIMITPGTNKNIVGPKAIEEAMVSVFALPDVIFDWSPEHCEVSGDGSLAVTRGTSKLTYTRDNEIVIQHGNYTTIWKKQMKKWKISWDIGN
jgi:ketosteroid isomerase-like protein